MEALEFVLVALEKGALDKQLLLICSGVNTWLQLHYYWIAPCDPTEYTHWHTYAADIKYSKQEIRC